MSREAYGLYLLLVFLAALINDGSMHHKAIQLWLLAVTAVCAVHVW